MQSIGDIIREFQQNGGTIELGIADPDLVELQSLPDTLIVSADLDAARIRLEALRARKTASRAELTRAAKDVEYQDRRYADAILRDSISTTRPPGCWCLGAGGIGRRYIPIPTGRTFIGHDGTERADTSEREVFERHCSCEEGREREKTDREAMEDWKAIRQRRRIAARFGDARIPLEYRDRVWREHPDTRVVQTIERWLADPKTGPEAKHWLLLYGKTGRGKTTLLAGLAVELACTGQPVLFRTLPDLLSEIRSTWRQQKSEEAELRSILKTVRHLFLDDVGAEAPRDWIGDELFLILNERHNEHLPTYLSSNLDLGELAEHLGSRIFGRIKRMAHPIELTGTDLRDL